MLNLANGASLAVDDNFGTRTKAAVKAWQTKKQIKADGIVGPQTWQTLCAQKSLGAAQSVYNQIAFRAGCDVSVPGAV
jgi:peptidoglycan hydrolase-like protein with peptidoglycan-binding domain